jgi:hypothetical protein
VPIGDQRLLDQAYRLSAFTEPHRGGIVEGGLQPWVSCQPWGDQVLFPFRGGQPLYLRLGRGLLLVTAPAIGLERATPLQNHAGDRSISGRTL